jgi:imidazolonepropionase-like amidohydrolase
MEAIMGRLVYIGDETSLENGYVVMEDGRITQVTTEKPECDIIGEYEVLTPGFIDAHCHIGTVRAGDPSDEEDTNDDMDSLLFELDILDSILMEDPSFKESMEAGVMYSCVLPGSANIIGGRSALIRNYAENTQDAFIKYTGLKSAFGFNSKGHEDGKGVHASTRMGTVSLLRKVLQKGQKCKKLVEHEKKSTDELEPHMDVVMALLEGHERLRIHVHKTDDIMAALRIAGEFNLDITIEHASDVFRKRTFELLKSKDIPVVYGPIDSFPYKVELKHESWRNTRHLIDSGCKFTIMSDHPVVLQRNLFMQLRVLRWLGLSKEKCISKLCREPAEILGADGIGTLAKGKLASVVCWKGDPFHMDNYPLAAYAEGRKVL